MLQLAPKHWIDYLGRISRRYAGRRVTLRQRETPEDLSDVILWRIPLRGVVTEERPLGLHVTVHAGEQEPYIEIPLGPVRRVAVTFDDEQNLEAVHLSGLNGVYSTLLLVDDMPGDEWV